MSTPIYDFIELPLAVEWTALTFGALSGALHATRKGLDLVGVFTIALLCSVGGGIIRDVLVQRGVPVFLVSPAFLSIAAFSSVVGIVFARLVRSALPVMAVVDTMLIGVWVVLGAERALYVGLPPASAVLLGVITATGGGLVRDLLIREVPAMVQPGQWYAAAAIVAAVVFVALVRAGVALTVAQLVTIVTATLLRAGSVRFGWRTPTAYDLWSGLETRVADRLEAARHTADDRARQRA